MRTSKPFGNPDRKNAVEKLFDLLIWLSDFHDVRSFDPVISAQKRAARGMLYSLLFAAVLCGCALAVSPDAGETDGSIFGLTATVEQRIAFAFSLAALVTSIIGACFIVRYVLVVKWPERFVDFSE